MKKVIFIQGISSQITNKVIFDSYSMRRGVFNINSTITSNYFAGLLYQKKDDDIFYGFMIDKQGKSLLSCVRWDMGKLQFVKKYHHRKDNILYSFEKKNENLWLGSWHGVMVGNGKAKCFISETDEEFFISDCRNSNVTLNCL